MFIVALVAAIMLGVFRSLYHQSQLANDKASKARANACFDFQLRYVIDEDTNYAWEKYVNDSRNDAEIYSYIEDDLKNISLRLYGDENYKNHFLLTLAPEPCDFEPLHSDYARPDITSVRYWAKHLMLAKQGKVATEVPGTTEAGYKLSIGSREYNKRDIEFCRRIEKNLQEYGIKQKLLLDAAPVNCGYIFNDDPMQRPVMKFGYYTCCAKPVRLWDD